MSLRGLLPILAFLHSTGLPLTSLQGRSMQVMLCSMISVTHLNDIENFDGNLHVMFDDRNVTEISAELRWHVMTCCLKASLPLIYVGSNT